MPNHTGVPPYSPTKYTGPNVFFPLVVTRNREPTSDDFRQPETGKLYPFSSYWLVGADPTTGTQGDLWYLSKIVASVAYWVKLSTGTTGPMLMVNVPLGVTPIVPTALGAMTFTSSLGTINITGSSAAPNNHTINFDLVGGSIGIDSFTVDYAPISVMPPTAPGAVIPNGAGNVTVQGRHNVVVEQQTASPNNFEMRLYAPYWFETTASIAAADTRPNFGYITNSAGALTIALPTTIAVGQTFHICGKGAGGWIVSQSAGQQIHFGDVDTTPGAGGSLASTKRRDCIHLVCTVANLEFTVVNSVGNITII